MNAIPVRCIEDCENGLIFAYATDRIECPTVFRCYCPRGQRNRHYSTWHPITSHKKFERKPLPKEVDWDLIKRFLPRLVENHFRSAVADSPQEEIPAALIVHFKTGDFVSELWELHKETFGREKLASFYRAWKAFNGPQAGKS